MTLLQSTQNEPATVHSLQLLNVLQDIATNVSLQENFRIHHPSFKPLELSEELVNRLHQMPVSVQERYRSVQLRSFLYGVFYNGSMKQALALDADTSVDALSRDLENNTFMGVDLTFYNQLHESNRGEGYFAPDWAVLEEADDEALVVKRGELKLVVKRDQHLHATQRSAGIGEVVAIKMPKNLVQNGFYMAVSNAGTQSHMQLEESEQTTVRVYFNVANEGAAPVMSSLTRQLNQVEIPFSFKVLYNPKDYNRHDSGVLYFDKRHYQVVHGILELVYTEHQGYFGATIPLYTKNLAPGMGLAEEPDMKFTSQESFGMNRCQIVANGLIEAWKQDKNSPEERLDAVLQQFSLLGIDWQRAYLNANSEDIYVPLSICSELEVV